MKNNERFILQPSQKQGFWVATDQKNEIVITFKEHDFNGTQKVTLLGGDTFSSINQVMKIPTALREMADWLRAEHYSKVMPSVEIHRERIGQSIHDLRKQRNMTRAELATMAGIKQSHLKRIEGGKCSVGLDILSKIADALGVSVELRDWLDRGTIKVAINYKPVDLGLPSGLLWADRNIGASDPERYGLYFAWGDTVGYGKDTSDGHLFGWDNCPWGDGSPSMSTLDAEHDAATVNMGADWRMPDRADFEELLENCKTTWATQNGVYGRLFISKLNGNTLFFPAAGYRDDSSLYYAGGYGDYWSRSLSTSRSHSAYSLYFDSSDCSTSYDYRYYGRSVRGVRAK